MKKTIITLLVLVLVAGAVFATDFKFSGKVQVGYSYDFSDKSIGAYGRDGMDAARMSLSVSDNWFSISLRELNMRVGSSTGSAATVTVDVNKLLATQEIELPVGVKAYIGNQSPSSTYSWADPRGTSNSLGAGADRNELPAAIQVTYEMFKFYAGTSILEKRGIVALTATPIDGITAQIAYAKNASSQMGISANVDVSKVASIEDFAITASGYGLFDFTDKTDNLYVGAVTFGYDAISAYGEFRHSGDGDNLLYVGAGYGLGFADAYADVALDCSDPKAFSWDIGSTFYVDSMWLDLCLAGDTTAAPSISGTVGWNF